MLFFDDLVQIDSSRWDITQAEVDGDDVRHSRTTSDRGNLKQQQKQAEDLKTKQAESILNFVEPRLDNLKRKNKGHSLKTPVGDHALTRDPISQRITITGKAGKVILEAKRAGATEEVYINNVQTEDGQAFTHYQAAREAKQKQSKQNGIDL